MARQIRVQYGTASLSWRAFIVSANLFLTDRHFFTRRRSPIESFHSYHRTLRTLYAHFIPQGLKNIEALLKKPKETSNRDALAFSELCLLAWWTKGLEVTNGKDEAYAMLWMLPDTSDSQTIALYNVDYNKPLETIYTEFTTALSHQATAPFFWLCLINSPARNPSLPSWVPDWSQVTTVPYMIWVSALSESKAQNHTGEILRAESIEGSRLKTRGIRRSKITTVIRSSAPADGKILALDDDAALLKTAKLLTDVFSTTRPIRNIDDAAFMDAILDAMQQRQKDEGDILSAKPAETYHVERLEISLSVFRYTVLNILRPLISGNPIDADTTQQIRDELCKFIPENVVAHVLGLLDNSERDGEQVGEQGGELVDKGTCNGSDTKKHPFLRVAEFLRPCVNIIGLVRHALLCHPDRDFFVTDRGEVGMAYQGVQEGDLVAVWKGFPFPVILRRDEGHTMGEYWYHSPAYVIGIMNGEAWPDDEETLQEFIIV